MRLHRCDVCRREINERSAGWTTIIVRRHDISVERDVCSSRCHRVFLNDEWPETRRPDFEGTRAGLTASVA